MSLGPCHPRRAPWPYHSGHITPAGRPGPITRAVSLGPGALAAPRGARLRGGAGVGQPERDVQYDLPQLGRVAGALGKERAAEAHAGQGYASADLPGERGVRPGKYPDQPVHPFTEDFAALFGGREAAERGLVLMQHPEDLAGLFDDAEVPAQHSAPRLGRSRLAAAPLDERVDLAEVVLDQAADDVFLGFEVVIQGRLGDTEPFGDLPQRGLLIPLLREKLQRHGLDPLPGVTARVCCRRLAWVTHRVRLGHASGGPPLCISPRLSRVNLLDGRLAGILIWPLRIC